MSWIQNGILNHVRPQGRHAGFSGPSRDVIHISPVYFRNKVEIDGDLKISRETQVIAFANCCVCGCLGRCFVTGGVVTVTSGLWELGLRSQLSVPSYGLYITFRWACNNRREQNLKRLPNDCLRKLHYYDEDQRNDVLVQGSDRGGLA